MSTKNTLKIVCINVERDKHYDRIIAFLKEKKPDVILLQEVFIKDLPYFEQVLNMKGVYSILNSFQGVENSDSGLVTLSSLPMTKKKSLYYRGEENSPPAIRIGFKEGDLIARSLLVTEYLKDKQTYTVINTHFTWTPDGHPTDKQYEDIDKMLHHLAEIPEFILCGDFNAPRGGPIFEKISTLYKDNIPSSVLTTIDKNLHKAGDLQLVVDGVFTTPQYEVESLDIISGLSDHCAIIAAVKITADLNK
jgi:endonuclease/exonuclease/phosphatase family metal-dependent hydrolase